jgi:hypothetical protein
MHPHGGVVCDHKDNKGAGYARTTASDTDVACLRCLSILSSKFSAMKRVQQHQGNHGRRRGIAQLRFSDLGGSGLPPPGYDIGGVSGGPMLMPTLVIGGVIWRFAGVIIEAAAGTLFEQVVAVRAHHIHPDGRIG